MDDPLLNGIEVPKCFDLGDFQQLPIGSVKGTLVREYSVDL
jgi:hypothetical protein